MSSAYGQVAALAVEPIEKKTLFHVYPGSQTLSLGTAGCNLGCKYCINWRVSQRGVQERDKMNSPADIIAQAIDHQVAGIAFTYTEPTIFIEYAQEIAHLAHEAGLFVVAKSNGYSSPAALEQMASWLDAINIDLKGWQPSAHHQIVGGQLPVVLDSLKLIARLGLWLEISTLIVPGLNDSPHDLAQMANFIANELGPHTPWHLLRFYPHYHMTDKRVTAQQTLQHAIDIAQQAGLHHIYSKEVAHGQQLHTTCPNCQQIIIKRQAYRLSSPAHGTCPHCNTAIAGVGMGKRN